MRRWFCRHFHTKYHELHLGNLYDIAGGDKFTMLYCTKCGVIHIIATPFGKDRPELLTKDRKGLK